jgi:hypothetical protein
MKMRRGLLAAVTLLTLGVGMFGASFASAGGPTRCTGAEGQVTIDGAVVAGPGCNLSETTVEGNVTVEPGGSLTTNPGSTTVITGNLQSTQATEVILEAGGSIGGNVQIQGTTGLSLIASSMVKGNVEIHNNVAFVAVLFETVGRNVTVQNNTGGAGFKIGTVEVHNSTVAGNVTVGNNTLTGTEINEVGAGRDKIAGNLQVQNNVATGGTLRNLVGADENIVEKNLEVHNNTASGPAGSIDLVKLRGNTVTNNLQCQNDTPVATGFNNTAKQKSGECAAL